MIQLIDTSVAVKWFIAEEGQQAAEALIGQPLIAPDLLLIEISNVAWTKWRKKQADLAQLQLAQSMVTSFVELFPSAPFAESALSIAIELDHPVYDCIFLAMAEELEGQLVTADKRLIAACERNRFKSMVRILE